MKADGHVQLCRPLHGFLYQLLIHQRNTVIRKAHCSLCCKLLHGHKLLPLHAHSHIHTAFHVDPCGLSFFKNIGKSFCIVNAWLGIGHHDHGGKPSLCCCSGSRFDIFLISKARIPEMYMDVHKARRYQKAVCVHSFRLSKLFLCQGICQTRADFTNHLPICQDIQIPFSSRFGIDHISIFYQKHLKKSPFLSSL